MKRYLSFLFTGLVFSLCSGELTVVPGFKVCSIELAASSKAAVKYRKTGTQDWKNAPDLVDVEKEGVLRGSLLLLDENTDYELQVSTADKKHFRKFKTRKFDVPVAKTIRLTKRDSKRTFKPQSGTADGYIRYVAEPGFVFEAPKKAGIGILIENAQYIILDGLTIKGGLFNAVRIRNSNHIRIVNCDISSYGEGGVFRPDLDGKYYNAKNKAIWHNAAVSVRECDDVIIERNYIHDPKTPGNSWFYSHPAGSDGLYIGNSKRVVVRYNDIVGSDKFRWNDAIAGDCGNFTDIGGPAEDAEIYGNYFAFGNDDSVELDGAQKNCRFFFNRIEGFFCGVSIAAVRKGPTYVYCNEITRPGDEFGLHGVALKTLCGKVVKWGRAFFYRNHAEGNPMGYPRIAGKYASPRITCRENVYPAAGKKSMYEEFKEKNYTVDTDDTKNAPEGVPAYPEVQPVRTNLLSQDKKTLSFSQPGSMVPQRVTITYHGKTPANYDIKICEATRHFKVTPENGKIEPGKSVTLEVLPVKSNAARLHSGAFVFRLENGWSIPVSVYLDSSGDEKLVKEVMKSVCKGTVTKNGTTHTLTFDVPEDGKYMLFVRRHGDCASRLEMKLPDKEPEFRRMRLRRETHQWDVPANEKDCNVPLELKKGKCSIVLQKSKRSSKAPDVTAAFISSDWHSVLPLLKQMDELWEKQ